ncbi:MAG: DnaD domain protein [Clostridia bacterium]|nr:DnaD domain protein [Clostridia bacterium]
MEFSFKNKYVPIPSEFIERYMVLANSMFIKVYLYVAYLAANETELDQSEISKKLDIPEGDIKNALEYWRDLGLLEINDTQIIVTDAGKNRSAKPFGQMTSAQIAETMSQSEELSELCILAQSLLGKTINSKDMETLYWIYDRLGMSVPVIVMILEYCADKDKRSMAYVEKVAVSWSERGISTIEEAQSYIDSEKNKQVLEYSLKKLFGINNRSLSNGELDFIHKWSEQYNMDEAMIALSYEYCILQTGKLSFPYMDSILENWYQKGIHTLEAAQAEHDNYKTANKKPPQTKKPHNSLESFMHNKFDE